MKDTTIIIVTYKSSHIICDALDKLVNKGYRIIVVDNASNDDIEQVLQEKYPNSDIELILLENNCGFGKANNLALEMVETEFALLLNPDAIIKEESIDQLAKCAKNHQEVALAGAIDIKSENPSKEDRDCAIDYYRRTFKIFNENDDYISVNFLCGGYVLLKMNIFKKIGFFDEKIFLYFEDHELCQRSLKSGYKNILVKNSFCRHIESSSTATNSLFEYYHLLYKRHWHIGWSKMYIKKNKSLSSFIFGFFVKLSSIILCLIKLNPTEAISRFGKLMGMSSNMLKIDCFSDKNRTFKIKEKIIL